MKTVKCICCSIFRAEIEELQRREGDSLPFEFHYLDSMLHIYPKRLKHELDTALEKEEKSSTPIILVYGDCHGGMYQYEKNPAIKRIKRINCVEALLGHDQYRVLRKEGGFFLLPEWTLRWKEIFEGALGLNQDNASSLMREQHTKLIYLDTQIVPIPVKELEEISAYTGLPYEIMPITLGPLLDSIREVVL